MTIKQAAPASSPSPPWGVLTGARRSTWGAATCLLGVAILLLLAGGCAATGTERALLIKDEAQFQSVVVEARQPALVMFFEAGCPACAVVEPTMDQLATEYQGRAVVAKFMIMAFLSSVTSKELQGGYGVQLVPHVVLLVNGQERQHWIGVQSIGVYRKGLDEVVSRPGMTAATAADESAR